MVQPRRAGILAALPPRRSGGQGEALQVEPMKSKLKARGSKRLKLEYDMVFSSVAFSFNVRHYSKARDGDDYTFTFYDN